MADRFHRGRLAMEPARRAEAVLANVAIAREVCYQQIRERNPGAPEAAIMALWTAEIYRRAVSPALLDQACTMIRDRGNAGVGGC